jgi:hypothetical protein
MSSILLRKLTKKSTLNFGKFKYLTVDRLLGMKKQIELTSIYFKLSTITFTDDILDEYGHKWNKKGDRLIFVECEKYV